MISQFNFPTVIRFGIGAIKELPQHLKDHGYTRPLVVTDPIIGKLPFFLERKNR
jgi:alcohol dehydrogenase class IV